MNLPAANEDAVGARLRVEPPREMKGGFDEQKLAVGVPDADGEVGEDGGDVEEEEDGEPLVVEIVADAEVAVEVGEVVGAEAGGFGGGGGGEREGLVLPDVVGGEGS